jgi:hypothetical protein
MAIKTAIEHPAIPFGFIFGSISAQNLSPRTESGRIGPYR